MADLRILASVDVDDQAVAYTTIPPGERTDRTKVARALMALAIRLLDDAKRITAEASRG